MVVLPAISRPQPASAGAKVITPRDTRRISELIRPCIATGVMWVKNPCPEALKAGRPIPIAV